MSAAAVLLALSACSGSGRKSGPAAATAAPRDTSTRVARRPPAATLTPPAVEVVAAERAFWGLYLQLGGRRGRFSSADSRVRLARLTDRRRVHRAL